MFESNDYISVPVYSVSDLNAYIRALLESNENLMDIWVAGEVSNLSQPRSGHIYFTLKDKSGQVRCVIWRVHAARLAGALRDGMRIEAHGTVSVYEGGGQYQLYVDGMRAAGEGQLYQEFLRLKASLTEEGLFDEERKREIPASPKLIGIVTSPTGAALQDMLNTLRGRFPMVDVVLAPATVQGDAAPGQIVEALHLLNEYVKPDAIIVGRGGGSLEDLWAFNDERVVRAVAASDAPVISGVGHETDFTLTDFASDLRTPTPTGAAVAAVPEMAEFTAELKGWDALLEQLTRSKFDEKKVEILDKKNRLEYVSPMGMIRQRMQRLDTATLQLNNLLENFFERRKRDLAIAGEKLVSFDPRAILKRGYTILSDEDGKLIHSTKQVKLGTGIRARVKDGSIGAEVTSIEKEQEKENGKES